MAKDISVLGYCEETVSVTETTQVKKVIAVLPKHVWVYICTYEIEKGKRLSLPYDCKDLNSALKYLTRAVESNDSVISYELFGETVVKKEKHGDQV